MAKKAAHKSKTQSPKSEGPDRSMSLTPSTTISDATRSATTMSESIRDSSRDQVKYKIKFSGAWGTFNAQDHPVLYAREYLQGYEFRLGEAERSRHFPTTDSWAERDRMYLKMLVWASEPARDRCHEAFEVLLHKLSEHSDWKMAGHLVEKYRLIKAVPIAERLNEHYCARMDAWLDDVQTLLAAKPCDAKYECRHSEDFSSVAWFGAKYQFNRQQARIVEALWGEWEKGGLTLTQDTIATRIGSSGNFEMSKTFRTKRFGGGYEVHPAWGTMIQTPAKGAFRLEKPELT